MIPKHLHLIFGLAPPKEDEVGADQHHKARRIHGWSLVHHACVASAVAKIKPDDVSFYYQYEPTGPWWDLTRKLVNLRHVEAPSEVFGRPVTHYAHKADVIRLQQLHKEGGIYLDVDAFVHRDFDDLLGYSTVLGQEGFGEGVVGLCNAVILAEKGAPFIERWYDSYRDFNAARWNDHSVAKPLQLSRAFPDEVTILGPKAFFWPLWTHADIYRMFGSPRTLDVRGNYANHLWESLAWDYLGDLSVRHVRRVDSAFHLWVRPYLEGLPDDYGGGTNSFFGIRRDVVARARSGYRIVGKQVKTLIQGKK